MIISKNEIEKIIKEYLKLKNGIITESVVFTYIDDSGDYPPYDQRSKTLREIDGAQIKIKNE